MSVEALAVVLHHSQATGTDKLVLLGVANHAGDGGAWPTASERTVQRSIQRLVKMRELTVQRQAGGTHDMASWQRPNRYEVTVKCPDTCDGTTQHRSHRRTPTVPAVPASDRVTQTSPADADDTPAGDAHVTQTVHSTTHDNQVSASVTTPRAKGAARSETARQCAAEVREVLAAQRFQAKADAP
jgi:hypothetical protein